MPRRRRGGGFPVEAFLRVVGPDLSPEAFGEGREGEDVLACGFEVVRDPGKFPGQGVQHPVELSLHAGRVWLVVDRVQQGFHPGSGGLACASEVTSLTPSGPGR